jgi:hypothetical protein
MRVTKDKCAGCYNDVYNGQLAEKCWSLEKAEMVLVPIDMAPPYTSLKRQQVPSCYKRQRYVSVKPEDIREDGYWKL